MKQGEFTEYFNDGKTVKHISNYHQGNKHGMQKSFYTDGGLEKEKEYDNGVEHGIERGYEYKTGLLLKEHNYVNGKQHGPQMCYMNSNVGNFIERSHYDNGILHGAFSQVFVNGDVLRRKGMYVHGKKDGLWIENNKEGRTLNEIIYSDHETRREVKVFFNNGKSVESIDNYVDDKKHGLSRIFYFSTGNLKTEYTYVSNKRHGEYRHYNEDGSLREEGLYENDSIVRK
ncbi:MAG: hypothetical protein LBQ60_07705 [Bacteroidales bacterium]|jgi:antitoxin component YwqK of YwqJK toxin-antitoxin module|nr:hypothetical protein [Bacteroidales bacterium]